MTSGSVEKLSQEDIANLPKSFLLFRTAFHVLQFAVSNVDSIICMSLTLSASLLVDLPFNFPRGDAVAVSLTQFQCHAEDFT